MQELVRAEEKNIKFEEESHELALKSLAFERDSYLMLVDVLYTSQGRVVYSEVSEVTTEFSFIQSLVAE